MSQEGSSSAPNSAARGSKTTIDLTRDSLDELDATERKKAYQERRDEQFAKELAKEYADEEELRRQLSTGWSSFWSFF